VTVQDTDTETTNATLMRVTFAEVQGDVELFDFRNIFDGLYDLITYSSYRSQPRRNKSIVPLHPRYITPNVRHVTFKARLRSSS
jgi:hypothetical protein